MANALVQFRTDESSKIKASQICEELGFDLQTYLNMCISRLIAENGVPFSMKISDMPGNNGVLALKQMGRISSENGNSEMTLDDINAEIAMTRKSNRSINSVSDV